MKRSYKRTFFCGLTVCLIIAVITFVNRSDRGSDDASNHDPSRAPTLASVSDGRAAPDAAVASAQITANQNTNAALQDRVRAYLLHSTDFEAKSASPKSDADDIHVSTANIPNGQAPRVLTFGQAPPSLSQALSARPFVDESLPMMHGRPLITAPADAPTTAVADQQPIRQYRIRSGDTFSNLAIRYFGREKYSVDISKANPGVNPRRLRVGQIINLPLDSQIATLKLRPPATSKPLTNEIMHIVKRNESLSTIAKQHYDDANAWEIIYDANRVSIGRNPAKIKIGQKLKIPLRGAATSRLAGANNS